MKWPFLPIAEMLHSSCAVVLGQKVYDEECPKIIDWLHGVFCKVSDMKYWVLYRIHPDYQYHLIRTGLPPAYHCEDTLILYGSMAMLCRYIEAFGHRDEHGRNGEEVIEEFNKDLRGDSKDNHHDVSCEQALRQETALAIYRWWKYEKPKEEKRRDDLMQQIYGKGDSMSYVTCPDNPHLTQIVFRELEKDEADAEKEMRALDARIEEDEQIMLHKLIDIRRSLWT